MWRRRTTAGRAGNCCWKLGNPFCPPLGGGTGPVPFIFIIYPWFYFQRFSPILGCSGNSPAPRRAPFCRAAAAGPGAAPSPVKKRPGHPGAERAGRDPAAGPPPRAAVPQQPGLPHPQQARPLRTTAAPPSAPALEAQRRGRCCVVPGAFGPARPGRRWGWGEPRGGGGAWGGAGPRVSGGARWGRAGRGGAFGGGAELAQLGRGSP